MSRQSPSLLVLCREIYGKGKIPVDAKDAVFSTYHILSLQILEANGILCSGKYVGYIVGKTIISRPNAKSARPPRHLLRHLPRHPPRQLARPARSDLSGGGTCCCCSRHSHTCAHLYSGGTSCLRLFCFFSWVFIFFVHFWVCLLS